VKGRVARAVTGAAGAALAAYGAVRLLELGWDNLASTVVWLVAGVVAHDALLAPAVVLAAWLASRRLPATARWFVARVTIVLGPLVLLSVPVLGRFGAKPDNPSLLDRPYFAGLATCAALVLLASGAGAWRRREEVDGG
jgi:hypothetical protein